MTNKWKYQRDGHLGGVGVLRAVARRINWAPTLNCSEADVVPREMRKLVRAIISPTPLKSSLS